MHKQLRTGSIELWLFQVILPLLGLYLVGWLLVLVKVTLAIVLYGFVSIFFDQIDLRPI